MTHSIKLYSPPIITAKQQITYGHGVNLVYIDALARTAQLERKKVMYFQPSWNHQGKRTERMNLSKETIEETLTNMEYELGLQLKKFDLLKSTTYKDNSQESRKNTQQAFTMLLKKGFITTKNNADFVLDMKRIKNNTNLVNHITQANYSHQGIKCRMMDLVKNLDGCYPITKKRSFATKIPNQKESPLAINPIFDLSVSPLLLSEDSVTYSIDGDRTFRNGTYMAFVLWSALKNKPFAKNVAVHGYISIEQHSDLYKNLNNSSDLLRYALLQGTNSLEDVIIDRGRLMKGLKIINKIVNLGRYFKNKGFSELKTEDPDIQIISYVKGMNMPLALEILADKAMKISRDIDGTAKPQLFQEYSELLTTTSVFFPKLCQEVVNHLKNQ